MPLSENVRRWFSDQVVPHEPDLRRYLTARFRSIEVDDVIQESYFRLITWPRPSEIRNLRAFLFRTARNIVLDQLRRAKSAPIVDVSADTAHAVSSDAVSAPERASRLQEMSLLETAIATLPPRCANVLRLCLNQDLNSREIAERLKISERAVNSHLKTGIERCKEFLRAHGIGSDDGNLGNA